jgi:thiamine biosynthesis lipoprotein
MAKPVSRRRIIQICAATTLAGMVPLLAYKKPAPALQMAEWRGILLGTEVSFRFAVEEKAFGERLIDKSLFKINRLEKEFSLFYKNSSVNRLNNNGNISNISPEMHHVLQASKTLWDISEGAFDITIQPLWEHYAADQRGDIKNVLSRVGFKNFEFNASAASFTQPSMAITLNGIAQGFITQEVADFLASEGVSHALVQLGEAYGLGTHPAGRPWNLGIPAPMQPDEIIEQVAISGRALATSGAYGMMLDSKGNSHLLDPRTGKSPRYYQSVSVIAKNAMWADGLSTALTFIPPKKVEEFLQKARKTTGDPGLKAYFLAENNDRWWT